MSDLKKDLLINMITSLVMKDQTYSILMNALLQMNRHRVNLIQRNMNKYKYKVNLHKLHVNKFFQFNTTFRDLIKNEKKHLVKGDDKEVIQRSKSAISVMEQ